LCAELVWDTRVVFVCERVEEAAYVVLVRLPDTLAQLIGGIRVIPTEAHGVGRKGSFGVDIVDTTADMVQFDQVGELQRRSSSLGSGQVPEQDLVVKLVVIRRGGARKLKASRRGVGHAQTEIIGLNCLICCTYRNSREGADMGDQAAGRIAGLDEG